MWRVVLCRTYLIEPHRSELQGKDCGGSGDAFWPTSLMRIDILGQDVLALVCSSDVDFLPASQSFILCSTLSNVLVSLKLCELARGMWRLWDK